MRFQQNKARPQHLSKRDVWSISFQRFRQYCEADNPPRPVDAIGITSVPMYWRARKAVHGSVSCALWRP
jgi:hypothetical protein